MVQNPELAIGTVRLHELIESIYAAVQSPELWPQVLDRVAAAIGGQQTVLFTDAAVSGMPGALQGASTDPAIVSELLDYYGSVNVLSGPCDAMFPVGDVRYSHLAVPDEDFEQSEFYHDFFRPYDMFYSCGIKVALAGQAPAYLSFQRPRGASAFGVEEGMVLTTLLPHLRRAFSLHRRMGDLRTNIAGLETALTAFDHVVFGLDADGRVVVANPEAQALVRAGDVLRLVNDRLSAPGQDEEMQRLIAAAVGAGTLVYAPRQGAMRLARQRAEDEALYLVAASFPGTRGHGRRPLAATVVLHDPAKRPLSRASVLRSLYGLTATEARVADLLLQGMEVREIAAQIRVTLETARFHVKRVLTKSGARKQSELIRLMSALPGQIVSA